MVRRNAENRKIPNPSLTGITSVFSAQIRRKLEFSDIIHYNNSTVGLCATKATVWEYSHAVFLQKGQMYMRTKRIIAKCEQYSGYGAGAGDTEYYEYECPCGKGDYSYIIYKGDDESRAFTYEDRKMLNIRVIKAIRDVEAEMKSSRTSPLTQIIKQKYSVSKSVLLEISKALDEKGADTLQIGQVNDLENRLQRLLNDMVSFSADEFSISLKTMNIDATKLLYALRPLINSRETGNTSLGINNILYIALILLLIEDDTIKTFLSGDLYHELIKQDHEHLLERSYAKSASSNDYALNLAALQDATLYDGRSSQTIVDASEYVLKSSRGYIASGKLRDYHAKLEFIECPKGMDEQYERVIEQISRFHTEGIPYHEIAVLVGNNKQVAELAQECSRQNIPAYIARQSFRLTDLIIWTQKNLQNKYGRWFSKEPSPFWVALQEFQDSRSN